MTLDGSASKEPQGDPLVFDWSGPFGAAHDGIFQRKAIPPPALVRAKRPVSAKGPRRSFFSGPMLTSTNRGTPEISRIRGPLSP